MKKILIVTLVVGAFGLVGMQAATADPGWGSGDNSCREYGVEDRFDNQFNSKAVEKFREETVALRKTLAVKRGEYKALLQQDNPDEKRAAALSGELFDLRNELQQKATERGISRGFGTGKHRRSMMADNGEGYRGRHRGEHMLDW